MFGRGLSFFTTTVSSEDEDTESDSSQVLYHSDNLNDNNLNSKLYNLFCFANFICLSFFLNSFVDSGSLSIETYENEKKVWDEVRENMSQQIVQLSETVKTQENRIKQSNLMYEDLMSANEQLQKEKDSAFNDYLNEKRTNEGQIEQILRLNAEVIQSMEEKAELEQKIIKLKEEIAELKESVKDPQQYYKTELGKVIEDKVSVDELFKLKCDEMKQLKAILADKIACNDFILMITPSDN